MPVKIPIDNNRITEFCQKQHIRKLWLFGSVLRDDFREDSDVDVMYEFEPDTIVGFKIFDIEKELSHIFDGRKVDLISAKDLNQWIRNHESFYSELIYGQG